ncbi:MAG: hypothetical protein JWM31_3436 [Solirubrobacterales bacterium]|nr:hypothetical protein [Solirubrobacterales bacterium]
MPNYPADAACAHSGHPAGTWDERIAGETAAQRQARYTLALSICAECPVRGECANDQDLGGGIRAGIIHPDKVPGWSGLDWGLPAPGAHLARCGTVSAYNRHLRNGEDIDPSCRTAATEYREANKRARHAA